MPTSTFANASGRGRLQHATSSGYATTRNAASSNQAPQDNGLVEAAYGGGTNYTLTRSYFVFDLTSPASGSAVPNGAQIQSAFIRIPGQGKTATAGENDAAVIVSSNGSVPLVQADYSQSGSTSFGSIAYGSYNTSGDNDISLNSTGLAYIVGNATNKFAFRFNNLDIGNTAPTGNNNYTFDITTVILSITWSPPAVGTDGGQAYFM